jgi:iron complex outermembrane recepter protein
MCAAGNNLPQRRNGETNVHKTSSFMARMNRQTLLASFCLLQVTTVLAATQPIQEIIVTGSRIARGSDFESPSPVFTVDRESIERSGYNNLQQLMEKLPENGVGAFSTRGNNQDSTANGAASISLRGLGADATLVLVNGRRVAISSFAENLTTSFVDINTIPVSAIERVEVLKDGSSAIYGSDAVAGVVNVILRDNFEGFETSASYGSADGYDETAASAIWGINGDDSNVTFIVDYFKNSTLFNNERGTLGTANQTALGGVDFRSGRGFPGTFVVTEPILRQELQVADPACPPASLRAGVDDDGRPFTACRYDFGIWAVLIPEAERTGVTVLGHQALGGDVELFGELAVQHNNSFVQGAPTPLDGGAGLIVPVNHPGNPFDNDITGDIVVAAFRTEDAGPRQFDVETDNLRGVLGLRGSVGEWSWEVAAQRARSESQQTGDRSQGWVRVDFLQEQINAGNYNPFGATRNSREVIDAITTSLVRRGQSDLQMYDAQISGDLLGLPAGTVRMAAGVEYREESVSDIPDDQFQRGLIFGTEAVSAAAARDNAAAFVEFAVPVLTSLELSIAARYDDYSDFGDTTNPKVAMRWTPMESLALRASWGTGFRAPSLAQIGLGPSQESVFFVDTFGCADSAALCGPLDRVITFTGNANLEAEESESLNLGAAWRPSDAMEITVDFWDIVQENKVDKEPFGFAYDRSCNDQASTVCVRGTPLQGDTLGPIQTINLSFNNIGEQRTSGIDLGGYFGFDVGSGRLALGLNYSHLLEFERVELNADATAFVTRILTGEYEHPVSRARFTADWGNDIWGINAAVNHVGEFEDTPDADFDGTLDFDTVTTREVEAFTTVNLQLRYTGIDNVKMLLGIDNVLDELPPFAAGDGDSDIFGYVQNLHNPLGRFISAKAVVNF